MTIDDITEFVQDLDGVLTVRPGPGDDAPEIAWGDTFFYYAPDGVVPRTQPFATIVTKDYPDDTGSCLDRPGRFRVNVAAGTDSFRRWTGHEPRQRPAVDADTGATDTVFAHPVYGELGWLALVNPGPRTDATLRELLRRAHGLARSRHQRRARAKSD